MGFGFACGARNDEVGSLTMLCVETFELVRPI